MDKKKIWWIIFGIIILVMFFILKQDKDLRYSPDKPPSADYPGPVKYIVIITNQIPFPTIKPKAVGPSKPPCGSSNENSVLSCSSGQGEVCTCTISYPEFNCRWVKKDCPTCSAGSGFSNNWATPGTCSVA